MTTRAAEAFYEAQHVYQHRGFRTAVYNPNNFPLSELPVIYGFNNGGPRGLMSAVLLAEDGTALGGHCCSSEAYMPADLGVLDGTRPDRHEDFKKHYPDGYRMKFVGSADIGSDDGLLSAIELANATQQEDDEP